MHVGAEDLAWLPVNPTGPLLRPQTLVVRPVEA